MSPQRVIRPAARRSPAGARSLLWTAAAAALPVIVTVLVLAALTLGLLVFSARGFDSLFAVVAVEWLVVNRVPLSVDSIELGFLPMLPPLIYAAVLARQTRAVLADVEQPGAREAGAAVVGVTLAGVLLTVLASLLVGSAASDFAVREVSLPRAVLWTGVVGMVGAGLGVWLYFRRGLREVLPLWVRGGIHLGTAFVAATWAAATLLVLVGLLLAWESVGSSLEIGKGFVGTAALAAISVAYLPNVVMAAVAILVGGEAHLGEASYSVFAVSRGPMPEVPLAAVLPTTSPHWMVQGLLLLTALVAAFLARFVAHWFRTTGDAVKATWLAAAVVAVVVAVTPVVAGGQLGVLGTVGTGSLIAAGMALLIFGVIGSATIVLSLAGLTRRRERAEIELDRRRRRVGVLPADDGAVEHDDPADEAPEGDGVREGGGDDDGEKDQDEAEEVAVEEDDEGDEDDDEIAQPAEPDTEAATEADDDAEPDETPADDRAEADRGPEAGLPEEGMKSDD
ncbi:DUF6350 family protein [Dietzia alimentaria]|uniref:cell division protein PerM n=1 Tax=Dietzia alimentaria TaxID=665550 RepID=UPI00029A5F57|nr:DUF6350 family protein [Dietzia alimentaria]